MVNLCLLLRPSAGCSIFASQGYCCKCEAKDTLGQSFGGGKGGARFPIDCNLWRKGLFLGGVPASAHCLRMNGTW